MALVIFPDFMQRVQILMVRKKMENGIVMRD